MSVMSLFIFSMFNLLYAPFYDGERDMMVMNKFGYIESSNMNLLCLQVVCVLYICVVFF